MTVKTSTAIDVEIFGSVYHVRGQNNPEHLQELAAYVDKRMQEVAEKVATVDTGKIAILAALNIADELYQYRKKEQEERVEVQERMTTLTGELERILTESP